MVVAAFGYFQVSVVPRRGQYSFRRIGLVHGRAYVLKHFDIFFSVQYSFRGLRHPFIGRCSKNGVNLRQLGEYLAFVSLGKAPCDDKPAAFSVFFISGRFDYRLYAFLKGVLNETACVYDDYLGLSLVRYGLEAPLSQKSEHNLAVDPVFVAAEGNKSYFRLQ